MPNMSFDFLVRYCTKWYKIASERVNSIWWDAVLAPLKELESVATSDVVHFAQGGNDCLLYMREHSDRELLKNSLQGILLQQPGALSKTWSWKQGN